MGDCKGGCCGCCGNCGNCGSTIVLTEEEIAALGLLAQIPFLPVARRGDSVAPIYADEPQYNGAFQSLEKRGLVSIDFDQPLKGSYGEAYDAYPIKGSIALTILGQQVLELLEIQGID